MLVLYGYTNKTHSTNLFKSEEINAAPVHFSCSWKLKEEENTKAAVPGSVLQRCPTEFYSLLTQACQKHNRPAREHLYSTRIADNDIFTTPVVFSESCNDDYNTLLTFIRNLNTEAVIQFHIQESI